MEIQPQHLTLSRLLQGRLFSIPDYQRGYSWTSSERTDLFDDIDNVFKQGQEASHFMATIVCLHRSRKVAGPEEFELVDIVDGQQRITTLIILLNAIKNSLDENNENEKYVRRDISELLIKIQDDSLLLLNTNQDTKHYFSNYIRNGDTPPPNTGETLSERNMLEAIRECENFVQIWENGSRTTLDLYSCIRNRLSFILHAISEEKVVYTVFEVLNSRGLEVLWLDRLRSILMGKAFELPNANNQQLISELHNVWKNIYITIGLDAQMLTDPLRYAGTLYQSSTPARLLSERDAVAVFRQNAKKASDIRKMAKWLLDVCEAYGKIIKNARQKAVTQITQARLLAVAIQLRTDLSMEKANRLLTSWEKISFRIYGLLRYDSRFAVGSFVRLSWRVINEKLVESNILKEMKSLGEDYSVAENLSFLKKQNYYENWGEELRYFMFRYEEYLTNLSDAKVLNEQWERIWSVSVAKSIEHIAPQSKWAGTTKHSLGNLLILPPDLNSRLGIKSPKEKKDAYRQTGLLAAIDVAEAIEEADRGRWTKKVVEKRTDELLKWAVSEWDE
ncbi:MAG: DUF262 domain-containing HNH endonuclease family protein [Gammaproteobacteria bacterium]|nr:DUF262 domain-containing HNH endonuclease family protein [Gammaproteobacteria bacterium]